jgi:hypothetical protein
VTKAALLLLTATTYGQNLHVGPNVRITDAGVYHVEPHIATHPQDAHRLLASVTHFGQGGMVIENVFNIRLR